MNHMIRLSALFLLSLVIVFNRSENISSTAAQSEAVNKLVVHAREET